MSRFGFRLAGGSGAAASRRSLSGSLPSCQPLRQRGFLDHSLRARLSRARGDGRAPTGRAPRGSHSRARARSQRHGRDGRRARGGPRGDRASAYRLAVASFGRGDVFRSCAPIADSTWDRRMDGGTARAAHQWRSPRRKFEACSLTAPGGRRRARPGSLGRGRQPRDVARGRGDRRRRAPSSNPSGGSVAHASRDWRAPEGDSNRSPCRGAFRLHLTPTGRRRA